MTPTPAATPMPAPTAPEMAMPAPAMPVESAPQMPMAETKMEDSKPEMMENTPTKKFPVIVVLTVIMVTIVAGITGFLFLTDTGKSILGYNKPQTQVTTSYSATSTFDVQSETTTGVIDQTVSEIDKQVSSLDASTDFSDFDKAADFGL